MSRHLLLGGAGVGHRGSGPAPPDRQQLLEQQAPLIAAGRIAGELLAMTVTLAPCADSRGDAGDRRQQLAGLFCAGAGRRLDSLWPDLEGAEGAGNAEGCDDHRAVVDWWTATPEPSPEFD